MVAFIFTQYFFIDIVRVAMMNSVHLERFNLYFIQVIVKINKITVHLPVQFHSRLIFLLFADLGFDGLNNS